MIVWMLLSVYYFQLLELRAKTKQKNKASAPEKGNNSKKKRVAKIRRS
jgi:hypothetical protein